MNTGMNAGVSAIAIDPVATHTVYAGTAEGVFKTTNGGATWVAAGVSDLSDVVEALAARRPKLDTIKKGNRGEIGTPGAPGAGKYARSQR
jgi:hypothetical protein